VVVSELTRAHHSDRLAGNPSDGYYGATVSFVIPNFRAEVIVHGIEHADQRNEEALLLDTTISHQGRSHRVRVFWSDTLGGHESPAPPDVSGEPWGLGARRLVHEACRRFFALLDGTPSADAELLQYDACQATTDLQIGYNSDIPVQGTHRLPSLVRAPTHSVVLPACLPACSRARGILCHRRGDAACTGDVYRTACNRRVGVAATAGATRAAAVARSRD